MAVTDLVGMRNIAYFYEDVPEFPLIGGRGVVPGGEPTPVNGMALIPGRGVVPGSGSLTQPVTLGLVKHKVYPGYETYQGRASRATLKFKGLRIPFGDSIISWLVEEAVEAQTRLGGGEMLELKIWAEKDWWGIIPTYKWTIEWSFYDRGLSLGQPRSLIAPPVIIAAIVAVIGLFAIVWILKEVKEIIWGPAGNGGVISSFTTLALVGGGLYLGFIALTRKKKK